MASHAPVRVLEAENADMARIFQVASIAFQHNEPFWDLAWPDHWLESGRIAGAERMRKTKNSDPHTTYLKAVDGKGTIVGMAKWNVYDNAMPTELEKPQPMEDHWATEDEKVFATHMAQSFLEKRHAALKQSGGRLVSLDILAIDPAYQRRGVGDALVKWGTSKADQLRVEAVVESSVVGKGLYEKNGFVFLEDVKLETPERWQGKETFEFAWLVRPRVVMNGTAA